MGERLGTCPLVGSPGGEWLGSRCQGNQRARSQEPRTPEELRAAIESLGATSSGGGHTSYLSISAFASYLEGGPEMGLSGSQGPWVSLQQSLGARTRTANKRTR